MSRGLITILYEDRQAKGERNYGPHMLLLACVADRLGGSRYALRSRVAPVPLSGDGNVKLKLREDGADLTAAGRLIAMFDHDRVRACYGLGPRACKSEVLGRIRQEAGGSAAVVLLIENMESLLAACCNALKRPRPATKPRPAERDAILQAAAADGQAAARAEILHSIPSFGRLVNTVCDWLAEPSTS